MEKQLYAIVNFKDSKTPHIFKCDNTYKVGDIVVAGHCPRPIDNLAIIRKIKKISDKKLPVEKSEIDSLSMNLDKLKFWEHFYALKYIKKYTEQRYVDDWKYSEKTAWITRYYSCDGCSICYEDNGTLVLTCGYYMNPDYVEFITKTSRKHIKEKIAYLMKVFPLYCCRYYTRSRFCELLKITVNI